MSKTKEIQILTSVERGEFKGSPTFTIWELDKDGNKKGEYPLLSFGKRKAKAIFDNIEEIENFLAE